MYLLVSSSFFPCNDRYQVFTQGQNKCTSILYYFCFFYYFLRTYQIGLPVVAGRFLYRCWRLLRHMWHTLTRSCTMMPFRAISKSRMKRCSICAPHCIHSRGRGIRFISVQLQAPLVSSNAPTYEHTKLKISLFTLVTVEFLKCAVDLSIFSYHHFAIVITGGIP